MTESEWLNAKDSGPILSYLREKGTYRKVRLFACAAARRIWNLIPDGPLRQGLELSELHVDGKISQQERGLALRAAMEAYIPWAVAGDIAIEAEPAYDPGTGGWRGLHAFGSETSEFEEEIEQYYDKAYTENSAAGIPSDPCPILARSTAAAVAYTACFRELHGGGINNWVNLVTVTSFAIQAVVLERLPPRHVHIYQAVEAGNSMEEASVAQLGHEMFGNPFHPISIDATISTWNDGTVVRLAKGIYEERAFDRMSVLADALEDAGCDNTKILKHCRQPEEHVRGCWVLDAILGRG